MAFVVCEPCIKCKYTDCVDVCPVNCFHEGAVMLAISPSECIDCGVCVDECPSQAIFPDDEVPEEWEEFVELNARFARIWPEIRKGGAPLPTADTFRNQRGKRSHFSESPAEPRHHHQ
jgi:ferredoxin